MAEKLFVFYQQINFLESPINNIYQQINFLYSRNWSLLYEELVIMIILNYSRFKTILIMFKSPINFDLRRFSNIFTSQLMLVSNY